MDPEVAQAVEITAAVAAALECCEPAIQARSMAYRAARAGALADAADFVRDAAQAVLAASPDLARRVTVHAVAEIVGMQLFAMLNGDLPMHDDRSNLRN